MKKTLKWNSLVEDYPSYYNRHNGIDPSTGLSLPYSWYINGDKYWRNRHGEIERNEKDSNGYTLHAFEKKNGNKKWYNDGWVHRDEKI